MTESVNVCCLYFDVLDCGDTDEHKHIGCGSKGGLINNTDTVFKCISNYNWINCEWFNKGGK